MEGCYIKKRIIFKGVVVERILAIFKSVKYLTSLNKRNQDGKSLF